jgi:hypothetical protein
MKELKMSNLVTDSLCNRLRRNTKHLRLGAFLFVTFLVTIAVVSCTTSTVPVDDGAPSSYILPTSDGAWAPPLSHTAHVPSGTAKLKIDDVGELTFEAGEVETLRPDIFQPGHFSLFDIVVHLAEQGDIELDYHFDESMDTHVIDSINGQGGWWYKAHYSQGWYETNVFRMDMYPYKNGASVHFYKEEKDYLDGVYSSFMEEVSRLKNNGGKVIIPELLIQTVDFRLTFKDVVVVPHDVRKDVLQPGVVTALDAILSLAEQGELSILKLTWYESIASADPIDSYWLEQINQAEAFGSCGLVYETGSMDFSGFRGSHIHIPADVRVTVSPEYSFWFWICL